MSRLQKMIMRHEGLKLKPYTDTTGHTSIGWGRNLTDIGIDVTEAEIMLLRDIIRAKEEAKKYSWYEGLNDTRAAVVIDMIYNLGAQGFSEFKATHRAIEAEDWEGAANHMLDSQWARQTGRRAREDAEQMRTGEWVVEA